MALDFTMFASGATTLLQTYGHLQAGRGARAYGAAQQRAAEVGARNLEISAGQAVAASHRVAQEERRQARLVASRALALAAASGTQASGVGINALVGDIRAEGSYRAAVALYDGEEASRKARADAAGLRFEGKIAAAGGRAEGAASGLRAAGSLFAGGANMYERYSQRKPAGPPPSPYAVNRRSSFGH